MGDGKIHLKKIKNNDPVKENDRKKFTDKAQEATVLYSDFSMQQWKLTMVAFRSSQEHRLETGGRMCSWKKDGKLIGSLADQDGESP